MSYFSREPATGRCLETHHLCHQTHKLPAAVSAETSGYKAWQIALLQHLMTHFLDRPETLTGQLNIFPVWNRLAIENSLKGKRENI